MARNQYKTKGKKASKKKGGVLSKWKDRYKSVREFLSSPKFQNTVGLLLVLSSIYLTVAFVSFPFTWKVDQAALSLPANEFFSPEVTVDNWLGKVGAFVAHWFIHNWFGLSSFAFVLMAFLIGFRMLFKTSLLPIKRTVKISLFHLIWLPFFFGYFFPNTLVLGGKVGYYLNQWVQSLTGSVGAGFLVVFSYLVYAVFAFDLQFHFLARLFERKEKDATETEITEEDEENIETPVLTNELKTPITTSPDEEEEEEEEEQDTTPVSIDLDSENTEQEEKENEKEDGDVGFTVEAVEDKEEALSESEINEKVKEFGEYDPTLDLASFQLPPIDLLKDYGEGEISINKEELETNKNKIVETLENYNIKIDRIKATVGPTVTLYEIVPAPGVRISKIKNLEDDIALSLAALGIRIIAPIPGKGTIGIEVPNQNPEIVSMRSVIRSEKFQNAKMELPVVMGKTISNEVFTFDLTKMPHLLMAGATGQGKSVGLNAVLTSLLYKKHPSQLKFVLVDPKKVELTLYSKIERHYLAKLPDTEEAIITDNQKVINTLNSLCVEMDQRYELLKSAMVRNIKEYNSKFVARKLNPENGHRFLPYIVLVVDEFADLIMTAGKEVETPIARLAQLARAIGIHLIIATQRPSANIITGVIKANFPGRIAFRVTSGIDSRTILDAGGAEQLIGKGDMLFSQGSSLTRLQCAFVDTPEVEKICDYIGDQRGYPDAFLLPEYKDESSGGGIGLADEERDDLFEDAARVIVMHQQGSASLLQRKLKLGYNRAGRIVDQLEAAGIIGPFEGSKARQVLIPDEMALEQFLNDLNNKSENGD